VPKGQIMLFADNPEAHSFGTHEWNQWWESHEAKFIATPENLSHFLDPLDLSTFGYLKKSMSKIQTVINLIHANPHNFTYQLNPLTLARTAVQPGSKLEHTDALTRCLGFENKRTGRTRIPEAEFVLQQLRGERTGKYGKHFLMPVNYTFQNGTSTY
jgi:hypothetical protein